MIYLIYCRCLSTFPILNWLHYLVDLVRPGSNDTDSCKRIFLHFFKMSDTLRNVLESHGNAKSLHTKVLRLCIANFEQKWEGVWYSLCIGNKWRQTENAILGFGLYWSKVSRNVRSVCSRTVVIKHKCHVNWPTCLRYD